MLVSANQILPSQDFLKPDTIKYILACIKSGELEKLPPAPIVRKDESGNLIAIDGHNLIAVKLKLGEDVEVHLAASSKDGLPADSEANIARNKDLEAKFDSVITDNKKLEESGISTFNDLTAHYEDLFH
jgi:hypothetical protein